MLVILFVLFFVLVVESATRSPQGSPFKETPPPGGLVPPVNQGPTMATPAPFEPALFFKTSPQMKKRKKKMKKNKNNKKNNNNNDDDKNDDDDEEDESSEDQSMSKSYPISTSHNNNNNNNNNNFHTGNENHFEHLREYRETSKDDLIRNSISSQTEKLSEKRISENKNINSIFGNNFLQNSISSKTERLNDETSNTQKLSEKRNFENKKRYFFENVEDDSVIKDNRSNFYKFYDKNNQKFNSIESKKRRIDSLHSKIDRLSEFVLVQQNQMNEIHRSRTNEIIEEDDVILTAPKVSSQTFSTPIQTQGSGNFGQRNSLVNQVNLKKLDNKLTAQGNDPEELIRHVRTRLQSHVNLGTDSNSWRTILREYYVKPGSSADSYIDIADNMDEYFDSLLSLKQPINSEKFSDNIGELCKFAYNTNKISVLGSESKRIFKRFMDGIQIEPLEGESPNTIARVKEEIHKKLWVDFLISVIGREKFSVWEEDTSPKDTPPAKLISWIDRMTPTGTGYRFVIDGGKSSSNTRLPQSDNNLTASHNMKVSAPAKPNAMKQWQQKPVVRRSPCTKCGRTNHTTSEHVDDYRERVALKKKPVFGQQSTSHTADSKNVNKKVKFDKKQSNIVNVNNKKFSYVVENNKDEIIQSELVPDNSSVDSNETINVLGSGIKTRKNEIKELENLDENFLGTYPGRGKRVFMKILIETGKGKPVQAKVWMDTCSTTSCISAKFVKENKLKTYSSNHEVRFEGFFGSHKCLPRICVTHFKVQDKHYALPAYVVQTIPGDGDILIGTDKLGMDLSLQLNLNGTFSINTLDKKSLSFRLDDGMEIISQSHMSKNINSESNISDSILNENNITIDDDLSNLSSVRKSIETSVNILETVQTERIMSLGDEYSVKRLKANDSRDDKEIIRDLAKDKNNFEINRIRKRKLEIKSRLEEAIIPQLEGRLARKRSLIFEESINSLKTEIKNLDVEEKDLHHKNSNISKNFRRRKTRILRSKRRADKKEHINLLKATIINQTESITTESTSILEDVEEVELNFDALNDRKEMIPPGESKDEDWKEFINWVEVEAKTVPMESFDQYKLTDWNFDLENREQYIAHVLLEEQHITLQDMLGKYNSVMLKDFEGFSMGNATINGEYVEFDIDLVDGGLEEIQKKRRSAFPMKKPLRDHLKGTLEEMEKSGVGKEIQGNSMHLLRHLDSLLNRKIK